MAIAYLTIKRQAALKLAQIIGSSQSTLNTAYDETDIDNMLDGAEIPALGFKDQILMTEKELAHIIGADASHPYRSFLYGRSANLANLASTPIVDINGDEFIGVFDSVADSDTNEPLTLQPTQTLADVSNSFFADTDLYYFNITGNQIRHTRDEAYLQGCIWDYTTQATAYDANGNSPLPEMLANTWVAGVCASSMQVGWTDQAQAVANYAQVYQQGIQLLKMGAGSGQPLSSQANPIAG